MQNFDTGSWAGLASAPKDGTRILALIKGSEQGQPEVDVVRWTRSRTLSDLCWVSADGSRDCSIVYSDYEVSMWMPLPDWKPPQRNGSIKAVGTMQPLEADGSGI